MTLLSCPECAGQISDQATACPHCGHPTNAAPSPDSPSDVRQLLPPSTSGEPVAEPTGEMINKKQASTPWFFYLLGFAVGVLLCDFVVWRIAVARGLDAELGTFYDRLWILWWMYLLIGFCGVWAAADSGWLIRKLDKR